MIAVAGSRRGSPPSQRAIGSPALRASRSWTARSTIDSARRPMPLARPARFEPWQRWKIRCRVVLRGDGRADVVMRDRPVDRRGDGALARQREREALVAALGPDADEGELAVLHHPVAEVDRLGQRRPDGRHLEARRSARSRDVRDSSGGMPLAGSGIRRQVPPPDVRDDRRSRGARPRTRCWSGPRAPFRARPPRTSRGRRPDASGARRPGGSRRSGSRRPPSARRRRGRPGRGRRGGGVRRRQPSGRIGTSTSAPG